MEQAVSDSEAPRRFNTTVIGLCYRSGLPIVGLQHRGVFRRATMRVAIRIALGQRNQCDSTDTRSAYWLATFGMRSGSLSDIAPVASLLFEVTSYDPITLSRGESVFLLVSVVR